MIFRLVFLLCTLASCMAWTSVPLRSLGSPSRTSRPAITQLFAALPEGFEEFGTTKIREAAKSCGLENQDDLTVEWKAGRIIVTVGGSVFVSAGSDEEGENDDAESAEDAGEDLEATTPQEPQPTGVDVTALARAINKALDDDGVGLAIAETHEIEVTTPGAPDELHGVMWEAYKGFDVICQQQDPKTKKVKQIDGRLVERNDEFTVINIKGRMKKMKNSTVLSVKLPKAKKEQGGR